MQLHHVAEALGAVLVVKVIKRLRHAIGIADQQVTRIHGNVAAVQGRFFDYTQRNPRCAELTKRAVGAEQNRRIVASTTIAQMPRRWVEDAIKNRHKHTRFGIAGNPAIGPHQCQRRVRAVEGCRPHQTA